MQNPWDGWVPGVLNRAQVIKLCEQEYIKGVRAVHAAVGHSSIDLSLDDTAFEMIDGSVKPGSSDFNLLLQNPRLARKLAPQADGSYVLGNKATYVFKLRERLSPRLAAGGIHGQATAKSSIGRVDVLARLIVDGMDTYEKFAADALAESTGDMYLEITPITFNVRVKPGIPLTQLRLFRGRPQDVEMKGQELFKTVLEGPGAKDGSLAAHLENETWGGLPVAAFCANGTASKADPIPLWVELETRSDPCRFWRFRESRENRLKIEKDQFYILRSKERIAVPPGIAIYCRASDETIGEMRIHYAGFVHPLFGLRRKKGRGTPLIFEVRGHQVDVSLADGEKMANLQFFRMSEDCRDEDPAKDKKGGTKISKRPTGRKRVAPSPYEDQTLKLSDFFSDWPKKLKRVGDDGTVEPA
jgi:dCTP deaminase